MPEEKPQQLNEEIKALEAILREKKQALVEKGLAPSGVEGEKALLKEAVKEHIEHAAESMPAGPPSGAVPPPTQTPSDQAQPVPQSLGEVGDDPLAGLDHREQIEELAAIAFAKGIMEAVNTARNAGSPHLLDEFHDALVDRLYDYLVEEGVIERSR